MEHFDVPPGYPGPTMVKLLTTDQPRVSSANIATPIIRFSTIDGKYTKNAPLVVFTAISSLLKSALPIHCYLPKLHIILPAYDKPCLDLMVAFIDCGEVKGTIRQLLAVLDILKCLRVDASKIHIEVLDGHSI